MKRNYISCLRHSGTWISRFSGDLRHRLPTLRAFGTGILFALFIFPTAHAQHLRIFACAIANDSVGAFMGGSSNGSGLYESDDTGRTWRHLGWENIKCYSMDEVDSSNGRILYEATGLGILRSTDYGAHWKQLTDWRISEAMDVAVNQKNPDEIYIATAHGPWRTEDGGKTWEELLNGLSVPYCSRVVIDSVIPNHVLLATQTGICSLGGNETWKYLPVNDRFDFKILAKLNVRAITQVSASYWIAASELLGELNSFDSAKSFSIGAKSELWCVSEIYGKGSWKTSWSDEIAGGPSGVQLAHREGDVGGSLGFVDTVIKNVASCLDITRAVTLFGTLGDGIFVRDAVSINSHPYNRQFAYSREGRVGKQKLAGRQIWTLKSFLVTP